MLVLLGGAFEPRALFLSLTSDLVRAALQVFSDLRLPRVAVQEIKMNPDSVAGSV